MIRRTFFATLLTIAVAGLYGSSSSAGPDDIVVIVNPQNPIAAIDSGDLRPIFQTTKTSWGNSAGDAMPLNLPDDNPLRQEFDKAVLGLDPDRVARYWQDRKIRGGARPPVKVSSTSAVVKGVAAKTGAVGYVKASEANATVKVVARVVDGKLRGP
jgi:ABC-type phosphate transport system substrate-binding protein